MYSIEKLKNIAEHFLIHGDITSVEQINKGYINLTYRVQTFSKNAHVHQYILQRINTNVFTNVDMLMKNFQATTSHLSQRLCMPAPHRCGTVQLLRNTLDGGLYYEDESGAWRLMTYFDNVYSLDLPDTPTTFYYAGVSFGQFIKQMSTIDSKTISEIIPNFHNTKSRGSSQLRVTRLAG